MKGQAGIRYAESQSTDYTDIYTEYGVTLIRGWREALLKPAPMKDYTRNDSRLDHGISIIAETKYAMAKEREVQLSCILEGETEDDYISKFESFIDMIAYSGMIYLKVPSLKTIFKLVYTDCSKYGDFGPKKGNFTLKFIEPNPMDRISLT